MGGGGGGGGGGFLHYIYTVLVLYSTFQVGCLREIRSNGEIGIRSIDAKIIQTTNPIVTYLPIPLFLSNNHPEMYCIALQHSMAIHTQLNIITVHSSTRSPVNRNTCMTTLSWIV